jgi:gamma-glutamyl-gamma-aminobutyrate hydrolase PuuD
MYTLGESEIMLEIEILKRAKYQFDIKRTTLKSDSYDHDFQRPNFIHNHSICIKKQQHFSKVVTKIKINSKHGKALLEN